MGNTLSRGVQQNGPSILLLKQQQQQQQQQENTQQKQQRRSTPILPTNIVANVPTLSILSTSASASLKKEEDGVLVPPKFGVCAPSSSPAMRARLPTEPSLWALLHQTDTSFCLLNDYLHPGFHVSGNEEEWGRFRASFVDEQLHRESVGAASATPPSSYDHSSSSSALPKYSGRIFLERLGHGSLLQLRFGTTADTPNVSAGLYVLSGCAVFGHYTSSGHAWAGALMDQTFRIPSLSDDDDDYDYDGPFDDDDDDEDEDFHLRDDLLRVKSRNVNLKLGTWLDGKLKFMENTPAWKDSLLVRTNEVNAYAAVTMMGALCAVETKLPLSTLQLSTKQYLSMDVNAGSRKKKNVLPLRLVMERFQAQPYLPMTTVLSLSQLLSFDRFQLNPLEDRASRVLNRVGWTVRMEHQAASTSGDGPSSNDPEEEAYGETGNRSFGGGGFTTLALGGAWQLNRAMALKAVLRPSTGKVGEETTLSTALIVKRWKQPRATMSVLFRHSALEPVRFLGIGVEIETGYLPTEEQFFQEESHISSSKNDDDDAPTRRMTGKKNL